MSDFQFDPYTFYASQGQISDLGGYAALFRHCPKDIPGLVQVIQGVMLHMHWAASMGITLNRIRKQEANLRTMKSRLDKIQSLSDAPMTEPRPISKRSVGTCRDYALLLTSLLRHRGIPARARAGFATYFSPGRFEDHWVCEYWHADQQRWIMVDAQLNQAQIETLKISFDPLDVPSTRFVTGGQAWLRCRAKRVDPNRFGIFRMRGLDFVKGDLIRDFLALNKIEILPWDNFQLIDKLFHKMTENEKDLMDRLAKISTGEDVDFLLLRAAFTANQHRLLPRYFI